MLVPHNYRPLRLQLACCSSVYIDRCAVDRRILISFTMNFFNSDLEKNISFVLPRYFIISGFIGIPNIKYYYVFLFLLYIVSVLGNTIVMVIICLDRNLRIPKYIAVFSLAFADLFGSSALVPKVLDIFMFDHPYVSYDDCLTFMFFSFTCLSMQPLNLVALSYDRLIAIIFPLHYHVKVTHRFMFTLIASFWLLIITAILIEVGLLTRLSFCKSVVIKSYFWDYGLMQELACNDNSLNLVISYFLSSLFLWLPLVFILSCYSYIGYVLSKVATVQERVKAFKTCTAHLSLVAIYFLPVMSTFAYTHPNARIINLSLVSTLPPMLNPVIYVLQTQEIKVSVKKLFKIKKKLKITVKTVIIK
uniref:G-protein coupled receptors family 1 profile domain-containing protein n=1 Tax=Monopterus albus TaxID=43700 RepID=A0A3Q3K015_MONAL